MSTEKVELTIPVKQSTRARLTVISKLEVNEAVYALLSALNALDDTMSHGKRPDEMTVVIGRSPVKIEVFSLDGVIHCVTISNLNAKASYA
jgi:hypothetical protein